ncbi:uncharacterized protein LOC128325719 [Hemicordylus capensis]|uniref:uncharacterized protein LOC128325719 n=1 Tax=Hemicordylus capensis TaxID=884348 RepID=UPI002303C644|nr:uncharacterized protein LOC128325719 [Hemicordylus capensis]XP_053107373.1 uncharacterized protein LOC128325719 [Hemicordylus capensis]XP_053107374.1 uncharacterized protein LOC128325719 [Hemicordylus capensis]XP_053107375.1 uncharacterized protein LOC128325719 [Hemicordylus capensis]XP_053107376.1 uncharacterized protein LOC128325719 [Hemicordylus capensis]XP_053107377.1 uncharacterized protein LOC128325719 [Hemicordylus capensis]XP_053107378.1 uncharacterized protein LOC128325719 [Hemico
MLPSFGIEKDKQRLLQASRNLYDCVYILVSSSNTIFRMLNEYLGTEFSNTVVRENLSIKENLQLLISALKEMQETVESQDKEVQQHVNVPLYTKIMLPISSQEERTRLMKDISNLYKGAFASICGPIAAVLLKHGNLPEKLEAVIRDLANCPVLGLQVSDLLMSHEDIAHAFPESSTSSSSPEFPAGGGRPRSQSVMNTTFSLTSLMQVVLRGQSSKNSIKLAANYMENVVKALKPVCESFKKTVKITEEYVSLIIDKLQ